MGILFGSGLSAFQQTARKKNMLTEAKKHSHIAVCLYPQKRITDSKFEIAVEVIGTIVLHAIRHHSFTKLTIYSVQN
jgi:hypothetical protein